MNRIPIIRVLRLVNMLLLLLIKFLEHEWKGTSGRRTCCSHRLLSGHGPSFQKVSFPVIIDYYPDVNQKKMFPEDRNLFHQKYENFIPLCNDADCQGF